MILFESVFQDVRYGARSLLRNGRFTIVSIFALALGIGVNTVAFTAYKAFIGRPLDARDPGAMVNISLRLQSGATAALFSYPDYKAYRDHLRSFSGVIAFNIDQLRLTDAGGIGGHRSLDTGSLMGRLGLLRRASSTSEYATTFIVSENYFSVLGVTALRGRTFESIGLPQLQASPSVLISENYWQRRFAGDPAALGNSVRLNGAAFTIVGITPHDFIGTSVATPDFWVPLSLDRLVHPESNRLENRDDLCCRIFGRLAPGVNMTQAQAETTLHAFNLARLHDPRSDQGKGTVTALISPGSPLPGKMPANLRLTILLIMLGVGMVLVIACANAASLQLARATTRQQELGMRLSLGASRTRLIRQLLTESALLGLLAGSIALPLTWTLSHLAAVKAAEVMPVGYGALVLKVNPDLEIFTYVLAISVAAGILCGLAPAIESSGSALLFTIRGMGTPPVRTQLRHLLVAAQVAVSLALMIAGSMLVRSAIQALRMETGYDGNHVIDVSLQFPDEPEYTADRKAVLVRDLRTRLRALPGVAAITSARAPDDHDARRASVSLNREQPTGRNVQAVLYYTWVQADYFQTLGVPLLLGRGFPSMSQPEPSVVLSESAAQRLWPGQNPIGRSLRLGTDEQFHNKGELLPDGPTWQVIGVARDTRGVTLDGSDSSQIYLPLPSDRLQDYPILVRTHSDPALVMRAMEPIISDLDPNLVASTSTLQEMLRQTDAFLIDSLSAAIASSISLFGLILALVGIYSTVSFMVVLRTREVGIRMAVGARKRDILTLMMGAGARPVLAGLLAGMVLAVGASHLLRGVLYGLNTVDAVSFAGASLLFLAIALVATWLPSRRAMRVDPMVALRYQ